ncbi:hypothetical protein FPF71_11120 [Algibacter amylolyticus]|uniref:Carboxypeptidase-like regulatory domain-containing protein n=1 Tax=Algibacter amylolyticus TaxID=1608400 RepID=A0A5M7B7F5_9FLAO|nr:carboxypeptidase-like regulatory domain-containing protein [Algibacter amylolyticus]KAA5824157.1 hypothetical protein F2B50_11120 [Algibacter amylolyticus]MBB5269716.1 hypothetical protein [Algibacter amylolyticus]TSJ74634.1 hypothetical protein FPF71_11120 [Algibacter amylolyticus]
MKKFILFLTFLSALNVVAQNTNRIEVSGKLIVEGSDVSGITIFNASANVGTITDNKGEFVLKVTLNDNIEVSALQYQNISFKVNEAIMKSRKMKLFLIEEINKLDEVIVIKDGLSGNLSQDLEDTTPFKPQLDALYFGVKNSKEYNFEKDYKTATKNIAIDRQHLPMINGLNIVNVVDQLLLPLFRSGVKDKEKAGVPDVPIEAVKYYFGSEFLIDNFNIPEHRVEEFIQYVQSDNFDFSLLNYGKEMDFLELLNKKSIAFLDSKN